MINGCFYMVFILVFFVCGRAVFCINYYYLLVNLISIEFMILRLFLFVYMFLLIVKFELIFSIIFLRFMVSEGVLGVSLLIVIVRILGNNYFQSIDLLKL